jgi:two-component system, NtrC family, response regulator HydG
MEYACVLCHGKAITSGHLPADFIRLHARGMPLSAACSSEGEESETIRKALKKTSGNKSRAAGILGISRRTIYRKIEKYGIHASV